MWCGECPEISRESHKHTNHDTAVKTLLTNSDDDISAVTVKNPGARNHETISVRIRGVDLMSAGALALPDAFVVANLPNGFRLSGGARFITLDVVARNEDTVTGDDLTRLEEGDITHEQFLDVDDVLDTRTDNFDRTPLLPVVEDAELLIPVPIAEGSNQNLWKEG